MDATAIPARLTGAGVYVAKLLEALVRGEVAAGRLELDVFAAPHAVATFGRDLGYRPSAFRTETSDTAGEPFAESAGGSRGVGPFAESAGGLRGGGRTEGRIEGRAGARLHPVAAAGRGRPARIAWTQLAAGGAASRAGAHVLHGVHYELPLRQRLPQVVTVHDLTLVTHPEWHERSKVVYFRWALQRALRVATRVLCVSATTARDLQELLEVDPGRIDVTPLGTDLAPASAEEVARLRERLGLHAPYLLGLGTLEPRKDLPALVAAFARLAAEVPHHLVIAGLRGWGAGPVEQAVRASGVADRIHLAGYVPERDKAALFTGAGAFAYPSHYEGFGLPVLEAMACGTPVVTTTGGSLPEVAGDAAELVPPGDLDALTTALRGLLGDEAAREKLTTRGLSRAADRTWDRCAELTAAAYMRAAGG